MDINNINQYVQIGTVVLPILLGFMAWCHKIYTTLTSTLKYVEELRKEFKPNGGASLKDSLNRIEKKLQLIDLTQKAYIDNDCDVPMFQTDEHGNCIWANKAYLALSGRSLEEVMGHSWEIIVDQNQRHVVREEWYKSVNENRPFDYNYVVNRENKKVLVRCKSRGSNKTGFIGFLEIIEEISHE